MSEVLRASLEEIMRVNPALHLATVSPEGRPHSATVWTAPGEDGGKLYWLSSPAKVHSQHIDGARAKGELALVSGALSSPQRPSMAVTGLSLEGVAERVTDEAEIKVAKELFSLLRVFFSDELQKYLSPPTGSDVATHGLYVAHVTEWTIFDGRLPTYNQRVARLPWPPKSD